MLDVLQAKRLKERYSLATALWKYQEFLRSIRENDGKNDNSKNSEHLARKKLGVRVQSLNFHSVLSECQTMVDSHCRKASHRSFLSKYNKLKVDLFRQKCTLAEFKSEIEAILNTLSLEYTTTQEKDTPNLTTIVFGSNRAVYWLFGLQIGINNDSLTINKEECSIDYMYCDSGQTDDPNYDPEWQCFEMTEKDNNSIIDNLANLLNNGEFEQFYKDLSFVMLYDCICNSMPNYNLAKLNVMNQVSKYFEWMCSNQVGNDYCYQLLFHGPSIKYHTFFNDKSNNKCQIDLVGVYPQSLFCETSQLFVKNSKYCDDEYLKKNVKLPFTQNRNNEKNDGSDGKDELLYWFVLKPYVIVPAKIANEIDEICLSKNGDKTMDDEKEDDDIAINSTNDLASVTSHSSWYDIECTYHNMVTGEKDYSKHSKINVFDQTYYYKSKYNELTSNGVKIEMLAMYDYRNLSKIIVILKQWLMVNQLYLECFSSPMDKVHKHEKHESKQTSDCKPKETMLQVDITINKSKSNWVEIHVANVHPNRKYHVSTKEKQSTNSGNNWDCVFVIDVATNTFECQIDNPKFENQVNTIFQTCKSIPMTLYYVAKAFGS